MTIEDLKEGNKLFKKTKFNDYKNDFRTLVEKGQSPEILFIGCSDSRVVPDLIISSKPGDMFIVRNVGNFVPPYKNDNDFHGTTAAIEFALSVLDVKHIIICGHSYCGACKSLYMDLEHNDSLVHMKKWLQLGMKAKEMVLKDFDIKIDEQRVYRETEKKSVICQLENLLTFPEVKKRIDERRLSIHGWYYKIEDGSIEYYNREKKVFE
ncbi:carbonic anhydrase [Halarcobacter ebronensis]|uniref:Carbonic anhydrase n=1 Tax=Halarcobacter ebronensis TaxID=1462615 RepID=A0A4Q1APH3_9BACT|nr:carbonic anhydrase [Halarcobacter ebronensis]QKF81037.1 beta carbonic anhydrase, clade B [Halarcobacter ebronensis]RXK06347.1 carbonic anhydrase [Halarcobacter ebronensis]